MIPVRRLPTSGTRALPTTRWSTAASLSCGVGCPRRSRADGGADRPVGRTRPDAVLERLAGRVPAMRTWRRGRALDLGRSFSSTPRSRKSATQYQPRSVRGRARSRPVRQDHQATWPTPRERWFLFGARPPSAAISPIQGIGSRTRARRRAGTACYRPGRPPRTAPRRWRRRVGHPLARAGPQRPVSAIQQAAVNSARIPRCRPPATPNRHAVDRLPGDVELVDLDETASRAGTARGHPRARHGARATSSSWLSSTTSMRAAPSSPNAMPLPPVPAMTLSLIIALGDIGLRTAMPTPSNPSMRLASTWQWSTGPGSSPPTTTMPSPSPRVRRCRRSAGRRRRRGCRCPRRSECSRARRRRRRARTAGR